MVPQQDHQDYQGPAATADMLITKALNALHAENPSMCEATLMGAMVAIARYQAMNISALGEPLFKRTIVATITPTLAKAAEAVMQAIMEAQAAENAAKPDVLM